MAQVNCFTAFMFSLFTFWTTRLVYIWRWIYYNVCEMLSSQDIKSSVPHLVGKNAKPVAQPSPSPSLITIGSELWQSDGSGVYLDSRPSSIRYENLQRTERGMQMSVKRGSERAEAAEAAPLYRINARFYNMHGRSGEPSARVRWGDEIHSTKNLYAFNNIIFYILRNWIYGVPVRR